MVETVGPYRIVEELGRGGMGIVFRGVHDRLEREVAIKQLAPELTSNPQFKDRFFSEAKTQAQLQHPNIVTIYDLIEEAGEYFIVMELFPGQGLDSIVEEHRGRGMPEEQALATFRQVLEALDSAHSLGVIHRDVKPSNVLIDAGGRVKLMDFGIALLVGDKRLTQSSQTIGTPVYMSPEQVLRPKELDHRTDIYSAAVMLYEMLAGHPPFDAETEYEIKKLHIEEPPADAIRKLERASHATRQALERALEKDPESRFPSAQEFLRSLPTKVGPPAPMLPPPTPAPRVTSLEQPAQVTGSGRQLRRGGTPASFFHSPWVWLGSTALLLLLGLGLWSLLSPKLRPVQDPPPAQSVQARTITPSRLPTPPPSTSGPPSPPPEVPSHEAQQQSQEPAPTPPPRVDPEEVARRQAAEDQRILARVVEETRKQIATATDTARRQLADGSYEQARETVKRALSQSAPYRSELVDEVVALQLLEQRVTDEILGQRTREEAQREKARLERQNWEGRLAEVLSLIEEGKYPEAQQLTESLLEDPELPADLAGQAQELRDRAQDELRNVWGKTEVEGSTEVVNPRSKKKREGGSKPPGGESWQSSTSPEDSSYRNP